MIKYSLLVFLVKSFECFY